MKQPPGARGAAQITLRPGDGSRSNPAVSGHLCWRPARDPERSGSEAATEPARPADARDGRRRLHRVGGHPPPVVAGRAGSGAARPARRRGRPAPGRHRRRSWARSTTCRPSARSSRGRRPSSTWRGRRPSPPRSASRSSTPGSTSSAPRRCWRPAGAAACAGSSTCRRRSSTAGPSATRWGRTSARGPDRRTASPSSARRRSCTSLAPVLGIEAVVLRPFSVYGPGAPSRSLVGTLLDQALHGEAVVLGDLRPVRDYCFVDDVAEAVARACSRPIPRPVCGVQRRIGTGTVGGRPGTAGARRRRPGPADPLGRPATARPAATSRRSSPTSAGSSASSAGARRPRCRTAWRGPPSRSARARSAIPDRVLVTGAQGFLGPPPRVRDGSRRDRRRPDPGRRQVRAARRDVHVRPPVGRAARSGAAACGGREPPRPTRGTDTSPSTWAIPTASPALLRSFRPDVIVHGASALRDDPWPALFRSNVQTRDHDRSRPSARRPLPAPRRRARLERIGVRGEGSGPSAAR